MQVACGQLLVVNNYQSKVRVNGVDKNNFVNASTNVFNSEYDNEASSNLFTHSRRLSIDKSSVGSAEEYELKHCNSVSRSFKKIIVY